MLSTLTQGFTIRDLIITIEKAIINCQDQYSINNIDQNVLKNNTDKNPKLDSLNNSNCDPISISHILNYLIENINQFMPSNRIEGYTKIPDVKLEEVGGMQKTKNEIKKLIINPLRA